MSFVNFWFVLWYFVFASCHLWWLWQELSGEENEEWGITVGPLPSVSSVVYSRITLEEPAKTIVHMWKVTKGTGRVVSMIPLIIYRWYILFTVYLLFGQGHSRLFAAYVGTIGNFPFCTSIGTDCTVQHEHSHRATWTQIDVITYRIYLIVLYLSRNYH